ncbi:hypothetical protein CTN01_14030 [Photobacterium angustum]|uniref:hypothetical protein n=1 Tax=Photobacterium angustum TaxID=661 RepID=UPI000D1B942F|nr:hypothetical protein [Photobacterium angustum]PSV91671.1 hypothetical protein CTN01_14030 [Photobacterium angustum]
MALLKLTSPQVRKIERLLDSWRGKLTWQRLIDKIKSDLNVEISRQSLNTYPSIKDSYVAAKHRLKGVGQVLEQVHDISFKEVDLLKENTKLKLELEGMSERFNNLQGFFVELNKAAKNNPLLMETLMDVNKSYKATLKKGRKIGE